MRLLKTPSHTSGRPGYEARKNAKKKIEGNADTTRRQTIRQNLPRTESVAGWARRQGAMARPTTVETLPRIVGVAGGRDEERRIEVAQARRQGKSKVKTLPQAIIGAVGARQKAKTNTKWKGGTIHSPARGGGA